MRILMIVPSFPRLSETFIVSKFLGLLDQGFDVRVLCQRSDPAEWDRFPELASRPGLRRRVIRAWPTRPRWLAALLCPIALFQCAWRNPRGFRRVLGRGWAKFGPRVFGRLYLDAGLIAARPDLIHFEFGAIGVGRTWLGEALDCKVVVSFRGYDLNYIGLDDADYYHDFWSEADALHLLGEDLWRRAKDRGCPPEKRRVLIPPAIDVERFTPSERNGAPNEVAGTPERPLRVLGVGRIVWKKGYDHALMAIRRLIDRGVNCEYRIVGEGDYFEAIAYARHQLDLTDQVHLLGSLPRQGVKEQAAWADVFLHASVSEGFCNAVVEAQAMALPVVCTDADGLPENVADGLTGFVVPRRDPDAMAGKLALLARNPELRQQMGAAGRQRVVERFCLSEQVEAFTAFYRQVLDGELPTQTQSSPT